MVAGEVPPGACLLVDAVVDSGWTLTVVAALLREAGCPKVQALALADAVVGSRDVDEAGTAFAGEVARWCARESLVVASGGARGVDRTAMLAAIEAGGAATGVLAGALGREAVSGWCREALRNGRLALVSPYGPDARFTVGGAMGRNRLIYCLADLAVVVSAAEGEGGTWAGATETLKHGGVPLAVRSGGEIPAGNRALLAGGAIEFSFESALGVPEPRVRSWLATAEAAGRVRRRGKSRSWELTEPTLF